ncbi:MAG: GNAT family N-acetyltransferase, partial [bacterium]
EVAIANMDHGVKPTGFESGSLFIPQEYRKHGLGSKLKEELAQQILNNYPGIPIFSVVDKINEASVHLNNKLGWISLDSKQIALFTQKLGIDVLQGWDAYIFLHPECLGLIQ